MLTLKVVFTFAFALATASAAVAAPKQASRHQTTIQRQVSAGLHLSLNSVRSTGSERSTGPANQSNNLSPLEYEGLSHLIAAIDEIAGN